MDSSPDLSVKLRRGSSDSRDNFYMGFAQGIDSDIEEVTTIQNLPSPPSSPALEEPSSIDLILPIPVDESAPETEESLEQHPDNVDEVLVYDEQTLQEIVVINEEEKEEEEIPEAKAAEIIEEFPIPPSQFQISMTGDEDEDETNTSVTVIQTKHKTPSSSSSSISSAENELIADEMHKSPLQIADLSLPPPPISTPPTPPVQFFHESEVSAPHSPQSTKSPPSKKSHSSSRKSPSSSSLASHKSPKSVSIQKSPPKKLDFRRNESHHDSDSIESINNIDCKIDDDNRDDSSPTDSMPPTQTPPPLEPLLLLERRYEYHSRCGYF